LCMRLNCAEFNRMVVSWARLDHMPTSDEVGVVDVYTLGCLNCHKYRSLGSQNLAAPNLTYIGRKLTKQELVSALKCPACVQPGSPMPSYQAQTRATIEALAAFLAASR
jgi:uncharacterized protein CbrC (UPF0167 family)